MAPPHFAEGDLGERRVHVAPVAVEDSPMAAIALSPPAPTGTTARCECARCGAHVTVRRSWQLTGQCGNCRSYELRPLDEVVPLLPVAAAAVVRRFAA